MYANGWGVPQDWAEAAKWLRQAADQDDGEAQYLLGLMYVKGAGVPKKDWAKGIELLRKAVDNGIAKAKEELEKSSEIERNITAKRPDGPVTIKPKPKPKPKVNITLEELIDAVVAYISQVFGVTVKSFDLEQDRERRETTVNLYGVVFADGTSPIDGRLCFDVEGICAKSERARICGDKRIVSVRRRKFSSSEYMCKINEWRLSYRANPKNCPDMPALYEAFVEIVSEPNEDKSITFFVVDRWEGNTAIFKRPAELSD